MSRAIFIKLRVYHPCRMNCCTVTIIFFTVVIIQPPLKSLCRPGMVYFIGSHSTETLWQIPSYQLTDKVLGLIVITRCRTSPFFKVLTFIVIPLSASNSISIRTGLFYKISYILCVFHSTVDHQNATEFIETTFTLAETSPRLIAQQQPPRGLKLFFKCFSFVFTGRSYST